MRPMLCKNAPADFLALKYPLAAEIKHDGVRTIAVVHKGKCALYSRNGKPYTNFEEIRLAVPTTEDAVYDGEVISPQGFQALQTRLHAELGKNKTIPIEYKIFDKLTPQEWMQGISLRTYEDRCINAGIGERMLIKNSVDLEVYYQATLKAGHEGLIVKTLNSNYESGQSKFWLKIKPKDTVDLTVTAILEGLGKYVGMLGAFICTGTIDGVSIYTDVGTGFTDNQRVQFWTDREKLIGKTIEIEYQETTQPNRYGERSLRFPSFKCLRLDK